MKNDTQISIDSAADLLSAYFGRHIGENADWIGRAWSLGPDEFYGVAGQNFLVEDEDEGVFLYGFRGDADGAEFLVEERLTPAQIPDWLENVKAHA